MLAEIGQAIGPGADKTLVEGFIAVVLVGGGGDGGEEDGRQQARQGGEGTLEAEFHFVGPHGPHRLNPIGQLEAQGAGLDETLQRKHQGIRIEAAAVMEQDVLAQGDAGPQAIGTELGQGGGQARFDAAIGFDRIKRIAQGRQGLHHAHPRGLDRIQRIDAAGLADDQAAGRPGRLAGSKAQAKAKAEEQEQRGGDQRRAVAQWALASRLRPLGAEVRLAEVRLAEVRRALSPASIARAWGRAEGYRGSRGGRLLR